MYVENRNLFSKLTSGYKKNCKNKKLLCDGTYVDGLVKRHSTREVDKRNVASGIESKFF